VDEQFTDSIEDGEYERRILDIAGYLERLVKVFTC
jgi:hypothetical protein